MATFPVTPGSINMEYECESIVKCLMANGKLNVSEIGRRTNLSRDLVKSRIACLEKKGIVVTEKTEYCRYCSLSGSMLDEIRFQDQRKKSIGSPEIPVPRNPVVTLCLSKIDSIKRLFVRNSRVRGDAYE